MTVPVVEGHTDIVGAYQTLHRLGLRVEFTQPAAISSLAPGNVLISPAAGAVVQRGSIIKLTPIGGPLGSPAVLVSNPHYRVPNLVGCTLSEAMSWVNGTALDWSIPMLPSPRENTTANLFDAYRVVGQSPKPGTTLGQGVKDGGGYRPTPVVLSVEALSQ